jgi:hypothetical protein
VPRGLERNEVPDRGYRINFRLQGAFESAPGKIL